MSKKRILITLTYIFMIVGFGVLLYSIFLQDTTIMYFGFGSLGLAIATPLSFKELNDDKKRQMEVFDELVTHIQNGNYKEVKERIEKEIQNDRLKYYLLGLAVGSKFSGDKSGGLNQIKFNENEDN